MEVQIIVVSAVIGGLQVQNDSQLSQERWVSRPELMGSGVRVSGETEGGALDRLDEPHGTLRLVEALLGNWKSRIRAI